MDYEDYIDYDTWAGPQPEPLVTVKFKKLDPSAIIPTRGSGKAAGLDLCALTFCIVPAGEHRVVPTGLAVQLPRGHEGQVRPRSGLAAKSCVTVLNSPGTIDEDYTGEIKVILINHGTENFVIYAGNRIAQLVVAPVTMVEIVEVTDLDKTERGSGGFGSSGV